MKDRVAAMRDYLTERGHAIPVDWTVRAFERDYECFEHSARFAEEEVSAILSSDVFIHLSDGRGVGKYVDLGIALAGHTFQQKPQKVYVVGSDANESQFYFHPAVNRIVVSNPMDALEQILQSN